MKNFDLQTIISLAAAYIEIDKTLTDEEKENEIFYDGNENFYSERVEAILDKHNVDYELFMHYIYDNDELYEQLRVQVEALQAAYNDLSNL